MNQVLLVINADIFSIYLHFEYLDERVMGFGIDMF